MTPKEKFPRMKLKHPKSMRISDLATICHCRENRSGPSTIKNQNRLFTESSLYTAPPKHVRTVKSELKAPKEFLKLQTPCEFMKAYPEKEMRSFSIHSLSTPSTDTSESEIEREIIGDKKKNFDK